MARPPTDEGAAARCGSDARDGPTTPRIRREESVRGDRPEKVAAERQADRIETARYSHQAPAGFGRQVFPPSLATEAPGATYKATQKATTMSPPSRPNRNEPLRFGPQVLAMRRKGVHQWPIIYII